MLIKQFLYMDTVWLRFLTKFLLGKSCEQSVQLLEKFLSIIWAATTLKTSIFFQFLVFWKKTSHSISIYENCMSSFFWEKNQIWKKRIQKF